MDYVGASKESLSLQVNCWNVYTHSSASLIGLRRLVNLYMIILNWTFLWKPQPH